MANLLECGLSHGFFKTTWFPRGLNNTARHPSHVPHHTQLLQGTFQCDVGSMAKAGLISSLNDGGHQLLLADPLEAVITLGHG